MLNYPLTFSFKIIAFNPQVRVTDAAGRQVMYIKQKALALKESVRIFADDSQKHELCSLKANKIIDFSAQYNITDPAGAALGAVKRQGRKSLWKATYTIMDATGAEIGLIREENPWLKVLDAAVSDIPLASMFVNPAYLVELHGQVVMRLKKQPALMEGKFILQKLGEFSDADERILLPSIVMTMMLERLRG